MKYKIIQNNNFYDVLEIPTKQVIRSFPDKDSARVMLRTFNLGGGFDGFTPSFFLKKCEIKLPDA